MTLALAVDALVAVGLSAAAALWLGRRAVRTVRSWARGGTCGCAGATSCGRGGPSREDLRRAAARGAARVNRGGGSDAG